MHNDGIVHFPFTALGELHAAGGRVAEALDRFPLSRLFGRFFDWDQASSTHGPLEPRKRTDDGQVPRRPRMLGSPRLPPVD